MYSYNTPHWGTLYDRTICEPFDGLLHFVMTALHQFRDLPRGHGKLALRAAREGRRAGGGEGEGGGGGDRALKSQRIYLPQSWGQLLASRFAGISRGLLKSEDTPMRIQKRTDPTRAPHSP